MAYKLNMTGEELNTFLSTGIRAWGNIKWEEENSIVLLNGFNVTAELIDTKIKINFIKPPMPTKDYAVVTGAEVPEQEGKEVAGAFNLKEESFMMDLNIDVSKDLVSWIYFAVIC